MDSKLPHTKKRSQRTQRGTLVDCLVIYHGINTAHLLTLVKQEQVLIDKNENRKFLIIAPPQIVFNYGKNKSSRVYVCDGDKGVTVFMNFIRDKQLVELKTDANMLSNILDTAILSRLSKIKPDQKLLMFAAGFGVFIGWVLGHII